MRKRIGWKNATLGFKVASCLIIIDWVRGFLFHLLSHGSIVEESFALHEEVVPEGVVSWFVPTLLVARVLKDTRWFRWWRRLRFNLITAHPLKQFDSYWRLYIHLLLVIWVLVIILVIIVLILFGFKNFLSNLKLFCLIRNQISKRVILSFELNLDLVAHGQD